MTTKVQTNHKPWWLSFGVSPGISTNRLSLLKQGIPPVGPRPFFVMGQQIVETPVYAFNGQYRPAGPNLFFPSGPTPMQNYQASSNFWNQIKQKSLQSTLSSLL